jgi:hypothetical protein
MRQLPIIEEWEDYREHSDIVTINNVKAIANQSQNKYGEFLHLRFSDFLFVLLIQLFLFLISNPIS